MVHLVLRTNSGSPITRNVPVERDSLDRLALSAMCCVMMADRGSSSVERARASEVLHAAGIQMNEASNDVLLLLDRIGFLGLEAFLDETCESLSTITDEDEQQYLLKCIRAVARADDKVSRSEKKVYQRLKLAFPDPLAPIPPSSREKSETIALLSTPPSEPKAKSVSSYLIASPAGRFSVGSRPSN